MKQNRNIIKFFIVSVVVVLCTWGLMTVLDESVSTEKSHKEVPLSKMLKLISQSQLQSAEIQDSKDNASLVAVTRAGENIKCDLGKEHTSVLKLLQETGTEFKITPIENNNNMLLSALLHNLPLFLIIIAVYYFFTNSNKGGSDIGSLIFGGSKSFKKAEPSKVRLKDIKGIDTILSEIKDVIEFAQRPAYFEQFNAKIPRGILLYGPPGTGKTLLAKAISGETKKPFSFHTGSEFVEVFVGLGASRIRSIFADARKVAEQEGMCIVYIDEIDSLCGKRDLNSQNSEAKATLNQFLAEMDGFAENKKLLIIGSTNRLKDLDDAVLRPGRFDRKILVPVPDLKGRSDILKLYLDKVPTDPAGLDLKVILYATSGATGAVLANIVNEAAIKAAKRNILINDQREAIKQAVITDPKKASNDIEDGVNTAPLVNIPPNEKEYIISEDLMDAMETELMGLKRDLVMSKDERELVAYHEAGHAVVGIRSKDPKNPSSDCEPIYKITIIPRGDALGMVVGTSDEDTNQYSITFTKLEKRIAMLMGGRVVEEKLRGKNYITTGPSSDIEQATHIATMMVSMAGFSEEIGIIHCFNRDYRKHWHLSDGIKNKIYEEAKKIIDKQYKVAQKIIEEYWHEVELIAKTLLEKETIEAHEVDELLGLTTTTSATKLSPDVFFYKKENKKEDIKEKANHPTGGQHNVSDDMDSDSHNNTNDNT